MRFLVIILVLLSFSCNQKEAPNTTLLIGKTDINESYLTLGKDTIEITEGNFNDTILFEEDHYQYIKLESWQWPRIVYLEKDKTTTIDFTNEWIQSDELNKFLLNKDSILIPYTAKWSMTDSLFRETWQKEFSINLDRIDQFFASSKVSQDLLKELKQMEYMFRGHLTANFISYQEKKGNTIDRDIYSFVDSMDLNSDRLSFHINNRNFQYYYYLDKTDHNLPESKYPFAVVDTIIKYVSTKDIREMIIKNVVKSGLRNEKVNHDSLFDLYEKHIAFLTEEDPIVQLYNNIQKLKPGNPAPSFGRLSNTHGDTISIEDISENIILLSVWGSWCPYCKEELPYLKNLINKYSGTMTNVAISLDKDNDQWKQYISDNDWEAIHLIDPERNSAFKKNYLISGTNVYFLIDHNRIIVSNNLKPSSATIDSLISVIK